MFHTNDLIHAFTHCFLKTNNPVKNWRYRSLFPILRMLSSEFEMQPVLHDKGTASPLWCRFHSMRINHSGSNLKPKFPEICIVHLVSLSLPMSNVSLPIDFCSEEISFHFKNKKVNNIQILKGKSVKLANMNTEQLM